MSVKSALILGVFFLFSDLAHATDPDAPLHSTLSYTYPFDTLDMASPLQTTPMVLELYSSLDCLFCPRAERLLTDLIAKTPVIAFSCHTDPEGVSYPLARQFCITRQEGYSTRLTDGLLYTPQVVINGHIDAVGYEFDDMRAGLKSAFSDRIVPLPLRTGSVDGTYLVDLPDLPPPKGESFDLIMIGYRPPYTVPKSMRQSTTRPDPLWHVASRLTPIGAWDGRAKTVSVSFTPSDDVAGFVFLVQKADGTIQAAADFKPAPLDGKAAAR